MRLAVAVRMTFCVSLLSSCAESADRKGQPTTTGPSPTQADLSTCLQNGGSLAPLDVHMVGASDCDTVSADCPFVTGLFNEGGDLLLVSHSSAGATVQRASVDLSAAGTVVWQTL